MLHFMIKTPLTNSAENSLLLGLHHQLLLIPHPPVTLKFSIPNRKNQDEKRVAYVTVQT